MQSLNKLVTSSRTCLESEAFLIDYCYFVKATEETVICLLGKESTLWSQQN